MRSISTLIASLAAAGITFAGDGAPRQDNATTNGDIEAGIASLRSRLDAALPQAAESGPPGKTAQWFNFFNCFRGGWRNC